MVRRVDRHGEALTWCRKCSGYARQRLGPKLMIRCKPEKMDTKEYGQMFKRILTLEEDGLKGQKKKDHQEGVQKDSGGSSGVGCTRPRKGYGTSPKRECWKIEELCPKKRRRDLLREHQAMHEENFLSSWLRWDVEGKEEEREKMNKEAKR